MMRQMRLEPRFLLHIPETLEPGVLYVSIEYATAVHSCCCGCGEEIVTPITPTDWSLTYNGDNVSLWPSVGNWNMKCRSHYFLHRGRVIEAEPWSDKRIENERIRDKLAKAAYFNGPAVGPSDDFALESRTSSEAPKRESKRHRARKNE